MVVVFIIGGGGDGYNNGSGAGNYSSGHGGSEGFSGDKNYNNESQSGDGAYNNGNSGADGQQQFYIYCHNDTKICYEFNTIPTPHHQASEACNSAGGHLVVIENIETQTLIENKMQEYGIGDEMWIGVTKGKVHPYLVIDDIQYIIKMTYIFKKTLTNIFATSYQ